MVYTISLAQKPVPHVSEADWKAKIWNLKTAAQTKTCNSYEVRNEVRQTRNEAVISRRWANYHNNIRLSDRVTEIRRWLNKLGGALQNLKLQSELLMTEKFETEKDIEKYTLCLSTLGECLFLRDSKFKPNLVNDAVGNELRLEIDSLEACKRYLTNKCFAAWEENNRLTELIFKLENELSNKTEALEIDTEVLKLDNTSNSATYKPDVLSLTTSSTTLEAWLEHAEFTLLSADNECQTATKLRDSISLAREKSKTDYLAQYEATNYALRRRSYETMKLKTELEYQKKKILDEMEKLQSELDKITKCKEETIQYLKCAESRLDTRNQRPACESTRDEAQMGLYDEIVLLKGNLQSINEKISETKATYNQLENYLLEIDREIKYQEQSIELDEKALEIHESLIKMTPISQVDKNIELFNMTKEMPPERPVVN